MFIPKPALDHLCIPLPFTTNESPVQSQTHIESPMHSLTTNGSLVHSHPTLDHLCIPLPAMGFWFIPKPTLNHLCNPIPPMDPWFIPTPHWITYAFPYQQWVSGSFPNPHWITYAFPYHRWIPGSFPPHIGSPMHFHTTEEFLVHSGTYNGWLVHSYTSWILVHAQIHIRSLCISIQPTDQWVSGLFPNPHWITSYVIACNVGQYWVIWNVTAYVIYSKTDFRSHVCCKTGKTINLTSLFPSATYMTLWYNII